MADSGTGSRGRTLGHSTSLVEIDGHRLLLDPAALHPWTESAERLLVAATRTGARVAIPRPGQTVLPASPPPIARWWPDVPWRAAEVAPIVSTGLEQSGEIRPRSAG
jgi:hypothetical protein